jgi:hypothetical protein
VKSGLGYIVVGGYRRWEVGDDSEWCCYEGYVLKLSNMLVSVKCPSFVVSVKYDYTHMWNHSNVFSRWPFFLMLRNSLFHL